MRKTTFARTHRPRPASSGSPAPFLVGVIRGPGASDADDARAFAAELECAVTAGCERVLVDLSGSDRLSTQAMNALLARRGRVVLVASGRLRRTFELLGLDSRFALVSDRDRAGDLLALRIARAA